MTTCLRNNNEIFNLGQTRRISENIHGYNGNNISENQHLVEEHDIMNGILSLSHNQLEIIFQFLSLKEIMFFHGTCRNLSHQVELYLYTWYVPRYFSTFELAAEENLVKDLSARSLVDSFSQIIHQGGLVSLQQLSYSGEHQVDLVQPLIECYEVILPGLFIKNKSADNDNHDDCSYSLHSTRLNNLNNNSNNNNIINLTSNHYQLLTQYLSKIHLPQVTMKLRQAAMIARSFSQLVINHNLRNKLAESKTRIQHYHLLAHILSKAPLPEIVSEKMN